MTDQKARCCCCGDYAVRIRPTSGGIQICVQTQKKADADEHGDQECCPDRGRDESREKSSQ